jgi:hemerythrin-like domain-containing protein
VPATARKADAVLFEHHQIIRGLFERIRSLPRHDPARRDLMRVLADELELHEHVEDEVFYPAVQPVSGDVPLAHAEHRQLADLLAVTLGLDTTSTTFDEHLRALHEAVDHHATSEERSMFVDAQRLGDHRLRELGHEVETLLDDLRASRFHTAWRTLKQSLMERAGNARPVA